jgi:acetolactate synthase-1/3 small subunit
VAIIKESKGFHDKLKEYERLRPGLELVENEFLDKNEQVFSM